MSQIGPGVCLLVGVEKGDSQEEALKLAKKITELRIFADDEGRMNLSLLETGGQVLAVSQFTLAGSTAKGRRPSFDGAEAPSRAEEIFNGFVQAIRHRGLEAETGVFGALMQVNIVNDGPVTFVLSTG